MTQVSIAWPWFKVNSSTSTFASVQLKALHFEKYLLTYFTNKYPYPKGQSLVAVANFNAFQSVFRRFSWEAQMPRFICTRATHSVREGGL